MDVLLQSLWLGILGFYTHPRMNEPTGVSLAMERAFTGQTWMKTSASKTSCCGGLLKKARPRSSVGYKHV